MLILARYENESICIDGGIEITVVEIERGRVKLGFTAPKDVTILRNEISEQPGKELSLRRKAKHQGKNVHHVPSGVYD